VSERADRVLRWTASGAILCALLLRALTTVTHVPGWEQDPTVVWIPDSGMAPAGSLGLDALVWLAVGAVGLRARRLAWQAGAAVLLGTLGVMLHGFVLTPVIARGGTGMHGHMGSLVLGSAWASALAGAWALREAAHDDGALRRTISLVLLGAIAPWGAKGLYQVLVEHPNTVASFERNRDEWLMANGWEPGSTSARLFERRLRQPEASGWFGLANVFGSMAGACLVAWAVIAVNGAALARTRTIKPALALAPTLAALLAFVSLFAAGSRGAIGAAAVVLVLLVFARFVGPIGAVTRRLAPWMGWLLVGSVVALVLVRGAFGERLGELSVYFRWQYLQGAARIFAGHLPFGVGPDGFKDAYLLAKPPTSPEEVESPHMLPADWLATLGLFGFAWLAVWLSWVRGAGFEAFRAPDEPPKAAAPDEAWSRPFALVCIAVPTLGSMLYERAVSGPDWPFVMLVAGVAWLVLVRVTDTLLTAAPERALRIAVAGAALVLAIHAMFDVAPVHRHAVGWLMALIALGAPARPGSALSADPPRAVRSVLPGLCALVVGGLLIFGALPAAKWGGLLAEASRQARDLPLLPPGDPEPPLTARPRIASAIDGLDRAYRVAPSQPTPLDRAVALRIRLANELLGSGEAGSGRDRLEKAVAALDAAARAAPRAAGRWARLGAGLEARGALLSEEAALSAALEAWERAASLDPYSLTPARKAAQLAATLGEGERAATWAERSLEIDANLRLDPLRRLTDSQRAELEGLAHP